MPVAEQAQPRVYTVHLKRPHAAQAAFIGSRAKRKVVRAGRRGGKTTGCSILAVEAFLKGRRVLYATPTSEQIDRFWHEVKMALAEPIDGGVFYKNETTHLIEVPGKEARIRAKTAWNADSLRGDYADLLILDEWQLMDEEAWEVVGAPMLLDNNGDAVFIYTPPSLKSRSTSKARDPLHAYKMYQTAQKDTSGRWEAFHFKSGDNPYISQEALSELKQDMTTLAIRQEIEAEDVLEIPGSLWHRSDFDVRKSCANYTRIVVAVDPSGSSRQSSDACGIIVSAKGTDGMGYVLADRSGRLSPDGWARRAVDAYHELQADCIIAETNFGGDMVIQTIRTIDPNVPVKIVVASRSKRVRAEPISAKYEQKKIFHIRPFPELEEQMCTWTPESEGSPDRMDALVWGMTDLFPTGSVWVA